LTDETFPSLPAFQGPEQPFSAHHTETMVVSADGARPKPTSRERSATARESG
jgi:hypothetical protein